MDFRDIDGRMDMSVDMVMLMVEVMMMVVLVVLKVDELVLGGVYF